MPALYVRALKHYIGRKNILMRCPAIIGLDMAVPEYYGSMNINIPLMRIASWAANIGATRFIPGLSGQRCRKVRTLSEKEKEIYKAVFLQSDGNCNYDK